MVLSVAGEKRRGCVSVQSEYSLPPPSAASTPPGPTDPSPSFLLSSAGGQPDSTSQGDFSLLSWKTLFLAPRGFQISGVGP